MPVNVMVVGHHLCKQLGVRDRSVRHKIPYEYESNNRVLAVLLDILFRMNMFFGMPRSTTKPYWELAARIERGVDELAKLQSEGELEEQLMIDSTMRETVDEILHSGTCRVLENLETRIDTMANLEIDSDIRASPDEFV